MTKSELRATYRIRRNSISADVQAAAGDVIAAQILDMIGTASCVYSYLDFDREIPTRLLVETLHSRGVEIVVPPLSRHADPLTEALRFAGTSTGSTEFLLEAVPEFSVEHIDVFLVPGIVWDERGYRIGFGGGFFDRLLAAARPDAVSIGLAYEEQVVPSLPADAWDIPVKVLLTDQRIIRMDSE